MDIKTSLPTIIAIVILVLKFSIGVNSSIFPWQKLKRDWKRFIASILILVFVAPLIAYLCIQMFDASKGANIAIILLSISPGAPLASIKVYKSGGDYQYAVLLQIVVVLISVFTIPLLLDISENLYQTNVSTNWLIVANRILLIVALPLLTGLVVRRLFPDLCFRYGKWLARASNLILSLVGLLLLYQFRNYLFETSMEDLFLFTFFIVTNLLTGHLLGGKDPDKKATIALMNASRHIGITIYIAANFYEMNEIIRYMVPYLIVNVICGILYVQWRKRVKVL